MISKECEGCRHMAEHFTEDDKVKYVEYVIAGNEKVRMKLLVKAVCEPVEETA